MLICAKTVNCAVNVQTAVPNAIHAVQNVPISVTFAECVLNVRQMQESIVPNVLNVSQT